PNRYLVPLSTNKKRNINQLHRKVRDDYDLRNLKDRIGGVLDNVPHKKSCEDFSAARKRYLYLISASKF
ncbi:MAG TPA: hypothetical protein DCS48_06400, partial [Desulfovibrio sp.]|nr:hypothetical protein [Desulfovibrio sp.]